MTGVDDHSRFCMGARLLPSDGSRCATRPGRGHAHLRRSRGIPHRQRQGVHRPLRPRPLSELFDRICADNGIGHLRTTPRSPTTTDKVERFHETACGVGPAPRPTFATLAAGQTCLDSRSTTTTRDDPPGGGHAAARRAFRLDSKLASSSDDAEPQPLPPPARPPGKRLGRPASLLEPGRLLLRGEPHLRDEPAEEVRQHGLVERGTGFDGREWFRCETCRVTTARADVGASTASPPATALLSECLRRVAAAARSFVRAVASKQATRPAAECVPGARLSEH